MLVLFAGGVNFVNAETDYTSSITNPNFSADTNGWTITGEARSYNKGNGFDGDRFVELTNWGSSWDATISQTVTELPNGYYRVKAAGQMSGAADCWMKLVANGAENYFSRNGDTKGNILADGTETTIGEGVAGWRYSSVIARVTDGSLTISCVGHSDSKERWANFDHVTLSYLGESISAGTDVTDFINNWDFWGCFNDAFNGWTIETSGGNTWVHGDTAVEFWNGNLEATFDYHQTVTNLPKGKYQISASMWNTQGAPNGNSGVYGTNSEDVTVFAGVTDDCDDNNLHTYSTSEIIVKDGTLRIGVKNKGERTTKWFGVDWIKLQFIEPYISAIATAIPTATATTLTADKWYKFTAVSSGDHSFAATTIADITCTSTDQLLSEATGTAATATMALTEGTTYYIKSSSAQSLTITPQSFSYTVGDGTPSVADNKYTQSKTYTLTFGSASTDDPEGTFQILDATKIKVNGVQATATLTGKVLTITLAENLTAATDYAISLAAGALGYNADNANTAMNLTVKTPAVFDGVYYMYNTDTKNYISRAGDYNTQAVMDNYGLAFNVSTDTENNTKLQYFDSELWLGDDGSCYGDCTSTRIRTYNITKVAEGYKFLNTNNSKYLAVNNGQTVGDAVEGDNLQGTSNIWNLESTAAHVANYTTNANKQATDVATAASLAGITTKAALDTELEANYIAIPVTVTGAKAEKYQVYPGNSKDSGPVAYHSETVNLTPGLYKLSVDAFQRATTNEKVFAADGARGLICLYAGAVKTQIKSVSEYGSNSQYASTDYADNGKYYPNREATGYQALETGNYKNEVYFYVAETGNVEIGIKNPSRPGNDCGTWAIYNNFTLTRYISASTTESVTVTPAGYATYVSTLPLDYTSTEIKAYTAKANDGKIVLTQINKVPANTPVVLYKEGGATEAIPVATTTDTPAASDLVAGTGAAVATAEGDYTNYILNVGTKGIGFYRANSQTVEANRAYMHVSNSETGSMSRMAIVFDNQTTGIANLKAAADGDDAIYNLNGQRIEKATKGIYIIDGKKMIMK